MTTYNVYYNKREEEVEVEEAGTDQDDTLMHETDYHYTYKHLGTVEAEDGGAAWCKAVDKYWEDC